MEDNKIIYSKDTIELVTVIAEAVRFFESAQEYSKRTYMDRALKILPLLYLKTSLIEEPEKVLDDEEYLEEFVNETEYEYIRQMISKRLGSSDRYLEIYTSDMDMSDEANACDVSEDMADIYQDLKNFAGRFQVGNEDVMNDALRELIENFRTYWGQKLTNSLRALHYAFYDPSTDFAEEEADGYSESDDDNDDKCECGHHHHHHYENCDCGHHHDDDALNKLWEHQK